MRPRAWLGGGLIALLAFAAWLGMDADRAAAAECPNEAIRIAQSATHLPNCRAYERISPADSKGGVVGVDTKNRPMFAAIRADGDAATFGSSSAVGETERGSTIASSLARRTAEGWKSFNVMTTTEPGVPMDLALGATWPTPSSDMSRMLFTSQRSLGPPNLTTGGRSIYLSAPEGKGPPTWLSRWTLEGTQPNAPGSGSAIALGGAPDFSSGYFSYPGKLTDVAGDDLRTSSQALYFFDGEEITPAGVLPSGTVDPLGTYPAGSGSIASTGAGGILPELARNQVSADGSKLFFVSPAEGTEPKQLYVEEGGKPGRLISHDTAGNAAVGGVASLTGQISQFSSRGFAAATPDGSRVVFRSEAALTDDALEAGIKTYRAEITPDAITLTYLPVVNGTVLAINKYASKILFSAPGSGAGQTSYYIWDEDRPSSPYTVGVDLSTSGGPLMLEPVFSEDANVLVFASGAEVEPGAAPLPEVNYTQIYRWTKQSGTTVCISCRQDGGAPGKFGAHMSNFNGLSTDNPANPLGDRFEAFSQSSVVGSRNISADGSRVFFDTSDPLDPARDVNGTRDVYMWEDGKNHLLTSGRGDAPSLVLDSSASGSNVMLVTKDGLIPSDTNQTYDVYTVRVDGGFDESVESGCAGDACQPHSTAGARPAATPASRSIRGPGNHHEGRLGGMRVAQRGVSAATAKLRIKVPASGRLKLAGNLIKNKARGVRSKGGVTVTVALNKAGKRKLARNDQLRTKVRVTFRDGDGRSKQRGTTLRFKQGEAR